MIGTLLLSELLAGGAAALASELIGRERIKGRIRETGVRHANRLLDGSGHPWGGTTSCASMRRTCGSTSHAAHDENPLGMPLLLEQLLPGLQEVEFGDEPEELRAIGPIHDG